MCWPLKVRNPCAFVLLFHFLPLMNLFFRVQELMEHFRPVFRHFFLEKFPDPAVWFERRLTYTRSVAISSIGECSLLIIKRNLRIAESLLATRLAWSWIFHHDFNQWRHIMSSIFYSPTAVSNLQFIFFPLQLATLLVWVTVTYRTFSWTATRLS